MGMGCRVYRVNRNLHVPGGPVLESDRTRESGDKLAMNLAFRGARSNCTPANQPRHVLRDDHVEEFRTRGNPHFGQIEEQPAPDA